MEESKILFASSNPGKFQEAAKYAATFGLQLIAPSELAGEPPTVAETEETYSGNAALKAQAYMQWSGLPALADDTGLEVFALNGQPGILTARYAGEDCSSEDNWRKLLLTMSDVSERAARFICALYIAYPDGSNMQAQETLEGAIATAPRGEGGFGYDPVFIVSQLNRTLAELKELQLPIETHRTKALRSLFSKLSALP